MTSIKNVTDIRSQPSQPDGQHEKCEDGCVRTSCEFVNIGVPIEIKPYTCIGKIEAECCGEPDVSCETEDCRNGCRIVITQRIKLKIPVRFDITASGGPDFIECACAGGD